MPPSPPPPLASNGTSTPPLHTNVGTAERVLSATAGGLLTAIGIARGSYSGAALATIGAALVGRGVSGYCPINDALGRDTSDPRGHAVEVHTSVTVNRPRQEVYALWRPVEHLPRFMHHLESVTDLGGGRSRWRARVPKGVGTLEWEAEIVEEREGSALAWRSLPGADVDNAGVVRFDDAPGGDGTEVHVQIRYRPPAGAVGAAAARWLDPVLSQMVKEDVRRFKSLAEAGEIPTTKGQPSGRD